MPSSSSSPTPWSAGIVRVSGLVGSAVVLLLVHALSRLATMSGMPDTAPVILSYAVYAALLVAAVLFLPGGIVSVFASARERVLRRRSR
jgi:branched-chain amino acid transport system permease protein